MPLNVEKERAALDRMTACDLRVKYAELFGEPTRSRHKEHLVKRILWRLQANAEGDLSERARRRATELAQDADFRLTPPRAPQVSSDGDQRTVAATLSAGALLLPGMALEREYKGRPVRVTVLADGFEHEGDRYKSLTAVVRAVTGQHWNGFHFFGLRQKGGAR